MTNKIPTTLEAARLSLEEVEKMAREAKAWYLFVTAHPELNFLANREVFRDFHNDLQEMTLLSLEESLPYVREKLAVKGQATLEEEIIETEIETRARFRSMSPEELRKVIAKEHQSTPLPEEITPEVIKTMPAAQLRKLLVRFGSRMVNMRLNSRQEAE